MDMINPLAAIAIFAALLWPNGQETSDGAPLLIRNLTVSEAHIVFSYAGDLWRVGRDGGAAERLTAGPEEDDYPVFSPDGQTLAFSRRTADDWDVYTVETAGGEARQLTYHPELDIARGWSPDGTSVLFVSHRDEEAVFRLYTIPATGVFPTAVALTRAWEGAFEPQGGRIAYVPIALPLELTNVDWRHYRGGMNSPIWIADLERAAIEAIPWEDSSDRHPMWPDTTVYFVSDRSGTFNLFAYNPTTHLVQQLTEYERYGVEAASAGGGVIAFVQDGFLRLYDRSSGEVSTVEVQVEPDRSELQPRTVVGAGSIQSGSVSGSGELVVFGVRGEAVTFDPVSGGATNLSQTSGAAERYPTISPDGQWIAYVTDESGNYGLRVAPARGDGPIRDFPVETRPSFYRELTWSPDSKRLAFTDKRLSLWVLDVETGGTRRVTTSTYSYQDRYQPAWSPDGSVLAYSRYESNRLRAIYLYDPARARQQRVTGGRVHAEHPVFDKSGSYLYFVASNNAALGEFGWSVLSGELHRPLVSRRLHVVLLSDRDLPPVLPLTGEPFPGAEPAVVPQRPPDAPPRRPTEGPPPGAPPGRARQPGQEPAPTLISPRGLQSRIVPLPIAARDFAGLQAGEPGVLYALVREWPAAREPGSEAPLSIYRYDLSSPRELTKLIEDVADFEVAADGRQILYRRGRQWALVSGAEPAEPDAGLLDLGAIQIDIDPATEWQQIYREAWSLIRDYFYDPDYHGQDLVELQRHYAAYLPSVTRRADLNRLLGKALGHVSVSHLVVKGGDIPQPAGEPSRIGLLGADYEIDEGRYRITRIFRSGHFNWGNPLFRSPFDEPGFYISQGEYLIAVNGEQITADRNLYSYFKGTAMTPISVTVSPRPDGQDARTFTLVPLPGENSLRRVNWAERNRLVVEDESQGVLGYVWIPGFSAGAIELVFQQLLESSDKRGLIIDQRFAGGGITADYLIEMLERTPLYYYTFRHGDDLGVPVNSTPRAKVLMINDVNASAAETFALMFKLGNLGRLIGTRTRGAGVGPYVYIPTLIDGGLVSIPNRAAYDPAGSWAIENHGIEPHLEVEWYPIDWRDGRDPQLQAAINAALQAIVDNPPYEVVKPDYPVRE
jgi:tricorn protease